jgi:predicted nucleic acid-binding protein
MRNIFHGKYADSFFTSNWAISESLQNYLRSYAMFNMIFDNLSFRYYESVRQYSRYRLPKSAFRQLKRDLKEMFQKAQDKKRLTVVSHGSSTPIHDYLYMGFDARDAEHVSIAIDQLSADVIVSKDRDFRDRRSDLKKLGLEVLYPSELMQRLTRR